MSAFREVQWRHFWGSYESRQYTPVHLYDPSASEVTPGWRKALCGKRFCVEDSSRAEEPMGRKCKACKKIAAKALARGVA